jgi:hypothetical protein
MELQVVRDCLDIMLEGLEENDSELVAFGIGQLRIELEIQEKNVA